MASKHKSNNAGNSGIPRRSYKVLFSSEKVKVLDKDKKDFMLKLLRSTVIFITYFITIVLFYYYRCKSLSVPNL